MLQATLGQRALLGGKGRVEVQLHSPIFLGLFIILPLLIVYLRWLRKRAVVSVIRFSELGSLRQMPRTLAVKALPLLKGLRLIVIALLILALARPQLSQSRAQRFAEGIDMLLAVDVSESMRAEDFEGANRLQTAKAVIGDFLRHRENDRVGLVVFAGESFTLCPLTLDYPVLVDLLGDVTVAMGEQLQDGTAIGDAIATATHRLRVSQAKTKIVILLTDGENTAGAIDPGTAATLAQSFGIKVYTIGMGKAGGALIPYEDTTFGKRYRKVLTYLDEDTLNQIASITGARYFRATDTQSLTRIYTEIDQFEKTKFEVIHSVEHKELAAYVLIPAALLLGIEILLSATVLRKIP